MKKYVFATGAINFTNCVFRTPQRAIDEANDLSKATGVKVRVYEEIHLATPDAQSALRESISLAEKHLNDIIEEPYRTLEQSFVDYIKSHATQHGTTPYAKIQRRADFVDNFKDGWALFNSNALFRTITMLVMNGASEYDLMLELIFMIDGHTTPDTSHLQPFHKQKPTDNETK